MAISGIGQNYYQNNVETKRNTKNVNGTEKFVLEKTVVLVYKCGQKKLNNLYYQVKE